MDDVFSQRVRPADDVLMRELEGESVILDLQSERYFGLDDVGTRMWTVLVSADSVQAAYQILLDEYEVTPQQLKEDLRELVADLSKSGLIRLEPLG